MQALTLGGFLPGHGANSTQLSFWVHALSLGGSRHQLVGANSPHLSLSLSHLGELGAQCDLSLSSGCMPCRWADPGTSLLVQTPHTSLASHSV